MKTYPVNDLYTTIQGEGALAGTPMTLLRFQGCPVGCPWCDTKETWALDAADSRPTLDEALGTNSSHSWLTVDQIVEACQRFSTPSKWVLVTGGEPALHNLAPLVDGLHKADFLVALETSGTAKGFLRADFDFVTVSPKWNMPGKRPVFIETLAAADEIKQVIGKPSDIDPLREALADERMGDFIGFISLQPVSQSEKATQLCIHYAFQYGYRVSVQVHKILELR